eukprot:255204_1
MGAAQANVYDSYPPQELQPTAPTDQLINKAVSNGKLKVASTQRIARYKQRFDEHNHLTTQHIIGSSISIPHSDWNFVFEIYFPWYRPRNDHHGLRSYNSYQLQKIYVYTSFCVSYDQLQAIDNKIIKMMSSGYKYFAGSDEKYPSIQECKDCERINAKRGEHIINAMRNEEQFIVKPALPSRKKSIFGGSKSAKLLDLLSLAYYLNIIFSSATVAKSNFVYDELGLDCDLKKLLRSLASNRLEAMYSVADQPCIRDPTRLQYKHGCEYEFHTVYIVRRPINDLSINLSNFSHWAIKMEGKKQLLTTGFYAYNNKHGIIKTQILPNTTINRRIFWYWWPKDEFEKQYFTDRWVVMKIIYVNKIHIRLVGKLICTWLGINSNYKYSLKNNNCQHYVRDLCTVFDMDIATKLDGIFSHKRINEAYTELTKTMKEYNDEQNILHNENKIDKDDQFLANWEVCAAALGMNEYVVPSTQTVSVNQCIFESTGQFHGYERPSSIDQNKNDSYVCTELAASSENTLNCAVLLNERDLYVIPLQMYKRWHWFVSKSNINNIIDDDNCVLNKHCVATVIDNLDMKSPDELTELLLNKTKHELKNMFLSTDFDNKITALLNAYSNELNSDDTILNIYKIPINDFHTVYPISMDDDKLKYGIQLVGNKNNINLGFESNNWRYGMLTHLDYILIKNERTNNEIKDLPDSNKFNQSDNINSQQEENKNDKELYQMCHDKYCWYIDSLLNFMKLYQIDQYDENMTQNVMEWYHHCLFKHDTKQLYTEFIENNTIFQCKHFNDEHIDDNRCDHIRRNDRFQSKRNRIIIYQQMNVNDINNATIQIFDMIHCYLFHSHEEHYKKYYKYNKFMNNFSNETKIKMDQVEIKQETKTNNKQVINDKEIEIYKCYQQLMIMGFPEHGLLDICKQFNGEIQTATEYLLSNTNNVSQYKQQSIFAKIFGVGNTKQTKMKSSNKANTEVEEEKIQHHDSDDIVCNFGFGIYLSYWKQWDDIYKSSSNFVKQKYKTLKEELTTNKIYQMQQYEYYNTYNKAQTWMKSKWFHTIIANNVGKQNDKFNIKTGELLTINHMICLLIYCNYTDIQHKYKQHCRPYDGENTNIFIKRNAEIAIWCRYLVECCCIYGERMNENDVLYTGLTSKLLFDSFDSYFYCPLSTTPNLDVAQRFTTSRGIIIQCKRGNKSTMKLNVSWLSDYPSENEKLIVAQSLKICNIIVFNDKEEHDGAESLSEWISCILLFEKIIEGLFLHHNKTLLTDISQKK